MVRHTRFWQRMATSKWLASIPSQPEAMAVRATPTRCWRIETRRGWFPAFGDHPEPLVAQTGSLRPAQHLVVVSVHGLTLITWEGLQFNGASDVFAITR